MSTSRILRGLDGATQGKVVDAILPLLQAQGASIIVVGHSLESALATYLTMALALQAPKRSVQACLFASPRTGNSTHPLPAASTAALLSVV